MEALYKLQPNKVHSKKMQYMKVHHGEVHHKEVHHEEVQLKLQRHKSDRWEKTTVGILRHCTSCSPIRCIARRRVAWRRVHMRHRGCNLTMPVAEPCVYEVVEVSCTSYCIS